jgi:hypothetical protein
MNEPALTLLHTAGLAGRLDVFPRLFTLIQQARAGLAGPSLLVDLGGCCAPDVPECAATQGRAALFVLDAMGYDLACVDWILAPEAARRLLERVSIALCGTAGAELPPFTTGTAGHWTVAMAAATQAPPPDSVQLIVRPDPGGEAPRLAGRTLWLPLGPGDRLGITAVTFGQMGPIECRTRTLMLRPDTRLDATVAAAVAFVREEVRAYCGDDAGSARPG